jgi:hypothetical protein
MNTRTYLIRAAIAAVLSCSSVHAQVLGGGLGGGLGGALNGGLNQIDVMGQGSANGSLGGRLDTGSLHRTTRDVTDHTTNRVRDTAGRVRNRAESTVAQSRDVSTNTAASAAGTATSAVNAQQIAAATNVAGSGAGDLSAQGANVVAAGEGAANQSAIVTPELGSNPAIEDNERLPMTASSDTNASGSGNASASRRGVSAQSAATAGSESSVSTRR